MLRIASFANNSASNGDEGESSNTNTNGQDVPGSESATYSNNPEDEDSDSDIEMYEPPEPTVDRSQLRGDPKAEVKPENGVDGGDASANNGGLFLPGVNLGAAPGGGGGLEDDLAATPEEEQRIEEQLRIQQQLYVPAPSASNENLQIIQGERRTYRCTLCQVELSSEPTRHSHQTGTKHLQKKQNHELENPDDAGKIWIVQVANPPPAKRKIIIRVHEKIRESKDPIIGLEHITELLPETDSEQEPVYECLICGQKGGSNANGIFSHLMGQQHRQEVMKHNKVSSGKVDSQRCLKYARDNAENDKNLENLIRTVRNDRKYPWPCDKAPWSKARGGSGVHPDREKLPKIKSEMKPSVNLNMARGIIPNPGETKEIKCSEEAERYLYLAKQLLLLLGESSSILSRTTLAIKKKIPQNRNTGSSNSGRRDSLNGMPGASGARGSELEGYGTRRSRDPGFSNGQSGSGSNGNHWSRSPPGKKGRYYDESRHHRSSRSTSSSPRRGPRENLELPVDREYIDNSRVNGDARVWNKETARYEERPKYSKSRSPQARRFSHNSRSPNEYRSTSRRSGDREEGRDFRRSQDQGASYSGRGNRNSEDFDRDSRHYSAHPDYKESSRSSSHRRSRSPSYKKRY